MKRFPWNDLAPVLAALLVALIALGVAWAVARGVLNERAGGVVNAGAGAAAAVVVVYAALWGRGRVIKNRSSGGELEGERRSGLMSGVRSRWIGMRDDSGKRSGEGKLAKDLALGNELEIFLERSTAAGAAGSASLTEAWMSAGHGMVLTGAPGAGKSVQLLLLAEKLLNDAERDPRAGVPVIVTLPAWHPSGKRRAFTGEDHRPFEEWLVADLRAKYRLPEESSRTWLTQGNLIPILDGLDETPTYHRQLLFEQIVDWVKDKERPPAAWALGCREREYAELDPNYHRMGSRSTFWSIKAVGNEQRTRFLVNAAERMNAGWQPVVDALERGEARHLTAIGEGEGEGEQGVLSTPLGLTIAVEAYQPDRLNDSPAPTEILNPQGDWDRLWTRYVSHHYHRAHRDPDDDDAGEIRQPYGFDEARRWLATLASEEIGIGREIDVIHIKPPDQPATWVNLWSFIKDLDRIEEALIWYGTFWGLLFVAFGALIGWRDWGGTVGFALVLVLAIICGWALKVTGFPKYIESARYRDFMEFAKDSMVLMIRDGHQYVALGILCALPGLLVLAAGSFWLGGVLAWLMGLPFSVLTRLVQWLSSDHIHPWPNLRPITGVNGGAMTGLAIAGIIAGLACLTYACAVVVRFIKVYRKRNLFDRTAQSAGSIHGRFFWWLDADDPRYFGAAYESWVSRHFLLSWWCYGSPIGSSKPTGLVPCPKDWDNFLGWAAHRGYLRRIGNQYVWLHETLRIWFRKYLDSEALAALGK